MIFSIKKRIKSFYFAFKGLGTLLKTQHNSWVHLLATVLVIVTGLVYSISNIEWVLIIISISMVWMAECLNTAIEFLADHSTSEYHVLIERAKDAAAAGVLVSAIGALAVGVTIFYPYIIIN